MLWAWLACVRTIPPYLLMPNENPHTECSQETAIRVVGFSDQSAEEAEQKAKRRLAESISSSLHAVQVSKSIVEQQEGVETSYASYDEVSTIETNFMYNHAIRIIEPVHRSKDGYRALACVTVPELEREVQQRHQSQMIELEGLYRALLEPQPIQSFSAGVKRFEEVMEPLLTDAQMLNSLSDGGSTWGRDLVQKQQRLSKLSMVYRKQNPLYLDKEPTNQQASQALSSLRGRHVSTVFRQNCVDEFGYQGTLIDDVSTQKGPMGGFVSVVSLSIQVRSCNPTLQGEQTVLLAKGQGYHSTNPDAAITAAKTAMAPESAISVWSDLYPL